MNDLKDISIKLDINLDDLQKIENLNVFKILLTNYTNNVVDYAINKSEDSKLGTELTLSQLIKFVHKHL